MALTCENCSAGYESSSPKSRFCSAKCRKAAFLARQMVIRTDAERSGTPERTTAAAVLAELTGVGREDSYLGRAAVALAVRIDESTAVMGFAQLVKQLQSTMDAAMEGVAVAADPVDEVRARRDRKFAAG